MRRRKGISLAIETIIFIILAVTVMSVLLLFFTKTGGEAQTRVDQEKDRIINCGRWTTQKPLCDSADKNQLTNLDVDKFIALCKKLDTPACTQTGKTSLECLKACCSTYCIVK